MPHLSSHPAPGLGNLLPGSFVVPQNPIDGVTGPKKYIPRVGELLPGSFAVPQNPIMDVMASANPLKPWAGAGGHTAGGCGCASCAGQGMGELDMGSIMSYINPGYLVAGIFAVLVFMQMRKN